MTLSRAARHLGGRAVTCRSRFSISNVGLDGREARQKTGKVVFPKMWEVFGPNELLPS